MFGLKKKRATRIVPPEGASLQITVHRGYLVVTAHNGIIYSARSSNKGDAWMANALEMATKDIAAKVRAGKVR